MKLSKTTLAAAISLAMLAPNTSSAAENSSETGLQQIIHIIQNDRGLIRKVSQENRNQAAQAASGMNDIIIEAIKSAGLANDQVISTADARELNDYIYANYPAEWQRLHGDDENGEETGFHLVQNNGARTKIFGKNAINRVADGIYHLGFETHKRNRLLNEDGNKNASFAKVGDWLNRLLEADLQNNQLVNSAINEVEGDTDTGLDQIIDIIYADPGLNRRISTGDMREGSSAANAMNHMIVEAITVNGLANDGRISTADMREVNNYLVENYQVEWATEHGDDEEGIETGFHLVQNDGAKTRLFGKNAVNKGGR